MDNTKRQFRFTSSQMYRLCASLKSGKPSQAFFGYVEEKSLEKMIGRTSKTQVKTQSMKWGNLMEVVLFDLIGSVQYEMVHKDTLLHPKYGNFWSGTPDLIVKDKKVGEIKCFEPLHFAKLSKALLSEDIEVIKKEEPAVYWQVLSNALILGVDICEIIAYMPYKNELEEIIEMVEETNFLERNKLNPGDYYFLTRENIESLPYLPDESEFSNINSFEFEVPKEDAEFLTERIIEASKLI